MALGEGVLVMLGLTPVGVNVSVDRDKLSTLGVGDEEGELKEALGVQVIVRLSDGAV